jgi:hypothetical protein
MHEIGQHDSVMPLQVARASHDVRLVQLAQDHPVSSKAAKANRRRRTHIVLISQTDTDHHEVISKNRDATAADHL